MTGHNPDPSYAVRAAQHHLDHGREDEARDALRWLAENPGRPVDHDDCDHGPVPAAADRRLMLGLLLLLVGAVGLILWAALMTGMRSL